MKHLWIVLALAIGAPALARDFLAIMNRPLEFEPGTRGHYSSSNYTLLGWVIEKQTGKSYGDALDEVILRPLGMRRTAYDAPEIGRPSGREGVA
jgi:CubicO group peptidase (beta-lactamase class C family)